ncbi:MAG: hypothetical protein OEY50_02745 [Nitrospinota bacterium]|nr:hypothetical protein [Nitrospinota bacterium]MDH5678346.1 hypothetical protein [Nitrospinota bacterium]MDH5755225.1 hypothetical protein [Nitrospinota bacterium]
MRVLLALIQALTLSMVMATSGCSTASISVKHPSVITAEKRKVVKNGADKQVVLATLGAPESRLISDDGETLFFKDINLSSVWVQFDKEDKVKGWEWSD